MRKRQTNSILCFLTLGPMIFIWSCFFGGTSMENEEKDNQCPTTAGIIDCNDPNCADHEACRPEKVLENCVNGVDDNGNGLTDCEDPECDDHEACRPEKVLENCVNGVDDNGNGLTDCEDPECEDHEACRPEKVLENCVNGVDDNGNGLTDCEDPECEDHEACRPENNCCETSESPGCNDYEIESCVCEKNPWCCEMKWDNICVQMVTDLECGDCTSPCLSDCTHPECVGHEACACETPHAAPGCGDTGIEQCVCDENAYCCEAEWDDICVMQIEILGCII